MEAVNWGIISASGFTHNRSGPAFVKGKNVNFTAVGSRDLGKAQAFAKALGIPKAYGSYEEVLDDPEIEAIYIPLPNHMHVEWSTKAAEAGKHVLCEKPIAMNAAEAERLIEVRARTGKLIQEAYMVLTYPQLIRARELVREGRIGELCTMQGAIAWTNTDPNDIRNQPETGGGITYDGGGYAITTSRFIFETEPTRVVALGQFDPEFKVDRMVNVILDFPNGQANFLASQRLANYERTVICGTKGRIEIPIPYNTPGDVPCKLIIDDGSAYDGSSAVVEEMEIANVYTVEIDVFSEAVREGKPQPVALEYSIGNMRVIDAVQRSMRSNAWESV